MTLTYEQWELPASTPAPGCQGQKFEPIAGGLPPLSASLVSDWNARRRTPGGPPRRVGEIKPNTTGGLSGGLAQIERYSRKHPSVDRRLLVTYSRQGDGRARVLVGDVAAVRPRRITWYDGGAIDFNWEEKIPIAHCPTCVGSLMEPKIHAHLKTAHKLTLEPKGSVFASGPDLQELEEELELLRELVAELGGQL